MKGENYKASQDSAISRCSTSAASVDSQPSSRQDEVVVNNQPIDGNGALYWQLIILAATSTTSLGASIILLLPFPVLLALALSVSSFMYMVYVVILLFYNKRDQIIQVDGIGNYLPPSVYNLLTESTLHEWLQDTSFTLEFRHLILYFIPGITEQQLEAYIDNLSPTHRYNLRRHGLGHFLGEDFMRLVMGGTRYQRNLLQSQQRPTELVIPPPNLMEFSAIDTSNDMASIASESSYSRRHERDDSQNAPNDVEERNITSREVTSARNALEEIEDEGNVLSDALSTMARSFVTTTVDSVSMRAVQVAGIVSQRTISAGMAVTALSTGAALFGMWYDTFPRRVPSSRGNFASSHSFLLTAVSGGISTGLLILARQGVKAYYFKNDKEEGRKKDAP
mmetsp:Transcript_99/g.134  ORF Transcript_99/g.134 Transcript_99/m.134 type:complete len:394 (-) Transcript_99:68-1249(-)|eukprot:CAMPEP_0194224350 /NCGR_PEP_ID=MMETSP0156-20130528/37243_1 /TAXON_ID=33649 /ORGANISM="Thalassionema nitzschioides, Strain L26-B" /LENGTH=393 /DNA_ID=CAMNT_0038955877 /DNA_START=62 /DNA_END=1243 /DNA_ORIENTATION=+